MNTSLAPIEIVAVSTSVVALIISTISLMIAIKELHLTRTAMGGKGLKLEVIHVPFEEVPSEYHPNLPLDFFTPETQNNYLICKITIQAWGPFTFYDVTPWMWSEGGWSETKFGGGVPVLKAEDGPVSFLLCPASDSLPTLKIGVVWDEPHGLGLRQNGMRYHSDGSLFQQLQEWRWYPDWIQQLTRGYLSGRWKRKSYLRYRKAPITVDKIRQTSRRKPQQQPPEAH